MTPSPPTGLPVASAPSESRAARARARKRRRRPSGRRLFAYDRRLEEPRLAGADEAGRGSLAGPLVAAAVLFDYERIGLREQRLLSALDDSKAHSVEAREELYPRILRVAERVAVVSRSVRAIDSVGLHKSNLSALREALERVTSDVADGCLCVIDGFGLPELRRRQRPIVDGDATSAAIAAASIVAKVTRDRYMRRIASAYPEWRFAENVGYSTPEHRAAITRHGVSPLHRLSFRSTAYEQLALEVPLGPADAPRAAAL